MVRPTKASMLLQSKPWRWVERGGEEWLDSLTMLRESTEETEESGGKLMDRALGIPRDESNEGQREGTKDGNPLTSTTSPYAACVFSPQRTPRLPESVHPQSRSLSVARTCSTPVCGAEHRVRCPPPPTPHSQSITQCCSPPCLSCHLIWCTRHSQTSA